MKRIALFLAALMLVLGLAACKDETVKNPKNETVTDTTADAEEITEATRATVGCKHQYQVLVIDEASCVEKGTVQYTCTVCKESYVEDVPAFGHQSFGTSCNEMGVCERCGEVVKEAGEHEAPDGICVHCGEEVA